MNSEERVSKFSENACMPMLRRLEKNRFVSSPEKTTRPMSDQDNSRRYLKTGCDTLLWRRPKFLLYGDVEVLTNIIDLSVGPAGGDHTIIQRGSISFLAHLETARGEVESSLSVCKSDLFFYLLHGGGDGLAEILDLEIHDHDGVGRGAEEPVERFFEGGDLEVEILVSKHLGITSRELLKLGRRVVDHVPRAVRRPVQCLSVRHCQAAPTSPSRTREGRERDREEDCTAS